MASRANLLALLTKPALVSFTVLEMGILERYLAECC